MSDATASPRDFSFHGENHHPIMLGAPAPADDPTGEIYATWERLQELRLYVDTRNRGSRWWTKRGRQGAPHTIQAV